MPQSRDPSCHSCNSPIIRIRRNIVPLKRASTIMLDFSLRGSGISSTISMSKTRKITANRKNRSEKGKRAEFFGSNPHSNGDFFSRSSVEREFRIKIRSMRAVGIISAIKVEI